ncbi:MAG: IS1182 family transposase [Pyrinomonadaceae bacterium]
MMSYIRGADRSEVLLFLEALDDYMADDNPVRFIDAFVVSLDLVELGFARATPAATGRPAYDPADLLKLYIYGYLNRVRSSRMLEREAGRNVEVMWLLSKLTPDFKTIADFRKDNLAAIKAVCREFTLLCKKLELFGGELIAIDGSKFRAVNNRKRNFNPTKLARLIQSIDERIALYLARMGQQDEAELAVAKIHVEELRAKINQLKERKQFHQTLVDELKQSGRQEISLTDADSRLMSVGQGVDVCYNVQTAVDDKHKLIVHHEVTNAHTDQGNLVPMATTARQVLGAETLEVVADKGYYSGEEIKKCEDRGIVTYIPKVDVSSKLKKELFTKEEFRYDAVTDTYMCPAGEHLTHRCTTTERKKVKMRYYGTAACKRCHLRSRCTKRKRGRLIKRLVDEAVLERMAERLKEHPEKMKLRKQLVEHPFGTIKRGMNQGYFLLKGIKKVAAEMSLTVMAYNIKRVLNILGVQEMIKTVA